jgi:hypothetical protein
LRKGFSLSTTLITRHGEAAHGLLRGTVFEGEERAKLLYDLGESRKELIILEPHLNAGFFDIDHEFESETYEEVLKKHIENYIKNKGQYK